MKLTAFACLLCAGALAQSGSFTNGRPFFVSFDYPADSFPSNITFRVHGSADITAPLAQWSVLTTNFAELAGDSGLRRFETTQSFPATLPIYYFVVSSSNEWGGPVFSPVVATAPPRTTGTPRLR